MLTAFRALPLLYRVAGILVLVAGLSGSLWGLYAYIRHQGFEDGYGRARQECADEKQKQETANQNAMNEAAKKLASLESQLELKDTQLDDYLKALDLAAEQEPGGGDTCLSADSVRRLGAIE